MEMPITDKQAKNMIARMSCRLVFSIIFLLSSHLALRWPLVAQACTVNCAQDERQVRTHYACLLLIL